MAYYSNYSPSYYPESRPLQNSHSRTQHNMYTPPRTPKNDDHNYQSHSVNELDGILEHQRNKFREIKQRLESELDNQRRIRIEFENKLIRIKDDFSRKDMQISELEFKLNSLLHQNQDLQAQNERLKSELHRVQQTYANKISSLENQITVDTRNFEDATNIYNSEFEKFKKEGREFVQNLTFEFDRKIKNLEEKLRESDNTKKTLASENRKLIDQLNSAKLTYEHDYRDMINRMRDEEAKKSQANIKSSEIRVRTAEDAKDALQRKLNDMVKVVQDKDRQLQNLERDKHEENQKLIDQITDLNNRISQMSYAYERLKADIAERDNPKNRDNLAASQLPYLRQQLEQKKRENEALNQTVRELRQNLKDASAQNAARMRELQDRLNYMQIECNKYKDEYNRLADILKSKINETISQVKDKRG